MYLKELELFNIRCFEFLKLDFEVESSGTPEWTMILGDNSSGKTTLLRSIALGLADQGATITLFNDINNFVKKDTIKNTFKNNPELLEMFKNNIWINKSNDELPEDKLGLINVKCLNKEQKEYSIYTPVILFEKGGEMIAKIPSEKNFFEEIFLCGYGASRSLKGGPEFKKKVTKYSVSGSAFSLFKNSAELGNLDSLLNILKYEEHDLYVFIMDIINKLFKSSSLDSNQIIKSVDVREGNILIKLNNGLELFLTEFGDGYKSIATLLLDFIGWSILYGNINKRGDLSGILLIDELEQHLHPLWQRKIVRTLRELFPKIQFITTTHSPLVAAGMADIDNAKIIYIKDGKKYDINTNEIKGLRADQILTLPLFGLKTTRNTVIEEKINKLKKEYKKPKSSKSEICKLKKELELITFETAEKEELREEQKELNVLVNKLSELNDSYLKIKFINALYNNLKPNIKLDYRHTNDMSVESYLNLKPIDIAVLQSISEIKYLNVEEIMKMILKLGYSKKSKLFKLIQDCENTEELSNLLNNLQTLGEKRID